MDQLAIAKPLVQGRLPRAARRGHRRRHRARHPRRGLGTSGRRLPRPAGEALRAVDRCGGRAAARSSRSSIRRRGRFPAPDAVAARARAAQGREEAAHHPRQGRGLRAGRRRHPRARREDRHPVPADVDGEGPAARHARAVGVGRALVRAARSRRGDADRRAPELAALARQGQDLGRQDRTRTWGGQKFIQVDISPQEADSNVRIDAPRGRRHRLVRLGAARRRSAPAGRSRRRSGPTRSPSARRRTSRRWPRRSRRIRRR